MFSKNIFYRSKNEKNNIRFRRSIFCVKEIQKGEKFNEDNIKIIRPGYGVSPIHYKNILNKKSPEKIKKNNPITSQILKKIKN